MINILTVIPNQSDATSFYRGAGPLGYLQRNYSDINCKPATRVGWAELVGINVVFMQRPYSQQHKTVVEMANDLNIPVWIDYDDDLFCVPRDNPSFDLYAKKETQKTIAEMIALSDLVTVSTHQLKVNILKLNDNIHVVPNAIDEQCFHQFTPKERKAIFTWRGSDTHVKDISTYAPEIREAVTENDKWMYLFIGHRPWYLGELDKNRFMYQPPMDIVEYFKGLKNIQPTSMMVPLADNEFNKCKSNIAWLEAVWSGALAICPDWPEWKKPGAIPYINPKDFKQAIDDVKGMSDNRINKEVRRAQEYAMEHFSQRVVSQKRYSLIKQLIMSKRRVTTQPIIQQHYDYQLDN